MKNVDPQRAKWMRVRFGMLTSTLAAGFVGLVSVAHKLQVEQGGELHLRDRAEAQYLRAIELPPRRGTIYDRHHQALAVSVDVPSLVANPRSLRLHHADIPALAARLAAALSLPLAEVSEKLAADSAYRWVKHQLTVAEVESVREILRSMHVREGDGVDLVNEPRRWYPNRELASNVIGFVGSDGHGLEGIEKSFDDTLRGRTTSVQGVRDAAGRLVFADGLTVADGAGGEDLTLTLDKTIQYIAEQELARTVRLFEARGGSVIVTDPSTGEVLAMANYPTFNPNEFSTADPESRRNRAVTDRFEPGSTLKVFTVGGALDAGVIGVSQEFDCHHGTWKIGHTTIHDAHPEGLLTPMRILARSSNICAAQIGLALHADGLERVLRRFGFGERTGLPLPGEARARFGDRRWVETEVATVSFGQGIGVTAVQLAQALGSVGNGGRLVSPLLVSRINDPLGALIEEHAPDPGRPTVDPSIARLVADMLTTVTEDDGTGVDAAITGVRVAGKTGTAQKAREHGAGYDENRWVASFIGFAPADHPSVVVTVVIDEPQGAHQGGVVAAPLFRRVAEQTLRYLGRLPASATNVALPVAAAPARDRVAAADTPAHGAITETAGEAAGTHLTPDLHGWTARRAVSRLHDVGIEASVMGTGSVVQQLPAAGSPVPDDGRVTLVLEPGGGAPAPRLPAAP